MFVDLKSGNFSDTVLSCFGDEDGKDGSECDVALSQVVSENSLSRYVCVGLAVRSDDTGEQQGACPFEE